TSYLLMGRGELMPEIILPSMARKFAASTPSGASASTDIFAGPSIIDAAACAKICASPVEGWMPSANDQVRLPVGSRSGAGLQLRRGNLSGRRLRRQYEKIVRAALKLEECVAIDRALREELSDLIGNREVRRVRRNQW